MKTSFYFSYLLYTTLFLISCNDQSVDASQEAKDASRDTTHQGGIPNGRGDLGKPGDTSRHEMDARIDSTPFPTQATEDFVVEAAGGGMMEVTLGQVAQQQAENQRIKDFGAMMVTDHTKANNELKAITTAKKFALPTALPKMHQQHVDELRKKQGRDFDKAYMKMMVDDHQKDIRAFEKAAEGSHDTTVKAFATRTLPTLRKHLDSAKAISRGM
jgi:putative membrane protein